MHLKGNELFLKMELVKIRKFLVSVLANLVKLFVYEDQKIIE